MPITVTHAKSNIIADFTGTVTLNNSSGGTQTALATDLVRPSDWNSAHQITLSLTGSEVASLFNFRSGLVSTTGAGGMTVQADSLGFFEPIALPNTNSTLSSPGIGTWYLDPFIAPQVLTSGVINLPVSNAAGFLNGGVFSAASTGSVTLYQTLTNQIALYSLGSGASATRLERVWSASIGQFATWERRVSSAATSNLTVSNYLTLSFPSQYDSAGGVTYGTTSQSGTTSVGASTGASTLANNLITGAVAYLSGARLDRIPFATAIPPGEYWLAHQFSSSSSSTGTNYSTGTMFSTHSRLGFLENNIGAYKAPGQSVSNSSTQAVMFHGFYATTSNTAPANIATSDVRYTTGRAYWNYQQSNL